MNPTLILCPIAPSAQGKSAIERALALARWYDAELHLLQVRRRGAASRAPVVRPLAPGRADARLPELVTGLDAEGVDVSVVELAGDPVTSVGDYARTTGADLAVVATNGRPFGYWRPGSYAADIVRHAACLTLAVPEARGDGHTAEAPFRNILCPTDFSPASTAARDHALVLAQQTGGRITLLHALERVPSETVYSGSRAFHLIREYRDHARRIEGELRRSVPPDAFNWCEVDTRAVSGDAHRAILATAAEIDADLIVMGLPDRSAWDRVVMGSTAMPVLRRAPCPVLVVPADHHQDYQRATGRAETQQAQAVAVGARSAPPGPWPFRPSPAGRHLPERRGIPRPAPRAAPPQASPA